MSATWTPLEGCREDSIEQLKPAPRFCAWCGLGPCKSARAQIRHEQRQEADRVRFDCEHNVIHTFAPLLGWEILGLERWKPGVVRFHARKITGNSADFLMGYAKDEVFAFLQLPAQEAKR